MTGIIARRPYPPVQWRSLIWEHPKRYIPIVVHEILQAIPAHHEWHPSAHGSQGLDPDRPALDAAIHMKKEEVEAKV